MKQKVDISISYVHDNGNVHVPRTKLEIYVDNQKYNLSDVPKRILWEAMTQCGLVYDKIMKHIVKSV